ncbi:MAG: TetR family transcriptional regulator [Actinomycetota bacterium]|nr:TetR family transcriptional regulator [Actinomycetota bacterium]
MATRTGEPPGEDPVSPTCDATSTRSDPARRLLAAADELFFRQGARATTVREITGACGLTPGALYNHFSSKEDLVYELVVHRHRRLDEEVTAAIELAGPDPGDRLSAMVSVFVLTHVRGRRGARVANREYRDLTAARLDEVVAIRRRLRDRLVEILLDGEAKGVFSLPGGKGRPAAVIAAAAILDMCVHGSEWLTEVGTFSLEELEAQYVTMARRLVSAPGVRPAGRRLRRSGRA